MRKLPLIVATAGLALVLAGCAGSPTDSSTTSPTAAPAAEIGTCVDTPSGDASNGVKVSGDANAKASATFGSPLSVESTERTVLSKGDGEIVKVGDLIPLNFTLFNGTSGDAVFSTYDDGQTAVTLAVDAAVNIPGLVKAIECAPAGSRVVAVVPPVDAFGTDGNEQLKIAPEDTLVFVIDMGEITPTMATGVDQPAPAGFPTVTLAADGAPTVTIPDTDPPADLQIAVLKKGSGAEVAAGAAVTVQYQGTVWASKTIFDQSWGKSPATFTTDKVIPGFSKALVGQTVGSQVMVIIPPAEGYGAAGQPSAGISGTDTLVFLVDILAVG